MSRARDWERARARDLARKQPDDPMPVLGSHDPYQGDHDTPPPHHERPPVRDWRDETGHSPRRTDNGMG